MSNAPAKRTPLPHEAPSCFRNLYEKSVLGRHYCKSNPSTSWRIYAKYSIFSCKQPVQRNSSLKDFTNSADHFLLDCELKRTCRNILRSSSVCFLRLRASKEGPHRAILRDCRGLKTCHLVSVFASQKLLPTKNFAPATGTLKRAVPDFS